LRRNRSHKSSGEFLRQVILNPYAGNRNGSDSRRRRRSGRQSHPRREQHRAGIRPELRGRCLAECLDTGWTHPSAAVLAEPIPGPTADRLCEAASRHQIYVVAGITERNGSRIYNAAVLISPEGRILAHHRKINELDIAWNLYSRGDRLMVADTAFGKAGLTICADNFPDSLELSRSLARMGAHYILSPCAWAVDAGHNNASEPYGGRWRDAYSTLCRSHKVTIIGVSNVGWLADGPWKGRKCIGCSLAMGPGGTTLATGPYGETAESLVIVEI